MDTHACLQSETDICSYSCIEQDECEVTFVKLISAKLNFEIGVFAGHLDGSNLEGQICLDLQAFSIESLKSSEFQSGTSGRKKVLQGNIETTAFGDGYVCNCVDHDPERFEFVWSCDNTPINGNSSDTQHQYG